ncbi:MAG: SpoIID/LytB domain-containing protein [Pseudomonadota bacterium]
MTTALLLASLLALPGPEFLQGVTVDGWTQQALPGVVLRDQEGRAIATSDARGRFSGQMLRGMPGLWAEEPHARYERTAILLPRDAAGNLLMTPLRIALIPFVPEGPPAPGATGVPAERHGDADLAGPEPLTSPLWSYTLPAQMPSTIRVLRCPGTTCCDAPGDGVQTMSFEDYVKGVVNAEVGIFRSMSTLDGQALGEAARQTGSAAVFQTLAVGSRSYALNWYLRRQSNNPGYDIRDGTCEQVYGDERHAWINSAVDATAGEILAVSGGVSIDSFEYASSCKRLGSLPYGVSASSPSCGDVVPDLTGVVACVGSWCGHDTPDMGHQTHPCDASRCRCLVRGICQWGAAERSFAGQDYLTILTHYQPNLVCLHLGSGQCGGGSTVTTGKLVGYVREGDIYNTATPITNASVVLSLGASTQSSSDGYYEFLALQPSQTVTVEASAPGYTTTIESKFLDPAFTTWWKSLALTPVADAGTAADARPRDTSSVDTARDATVEAGALDHWVLRDAGEAGPLDSATKPPDPRVGSGGCDCTSLLQDTRPAWWAALALLLALRRSRG